MDVLLARRFRRRPLSCFFFFFFFFFSSPLLCLGDSSLPPLAYRYASFAVPNPEEAASYFERYTGADRLAESDYLLGPRGEAAKVAGCRLSFPSGFSDVYFQNDPSLPYASETDEFASLVARTHSMANDDWDWWQDWHLAFVTTDIDAVAMRLMKDGVPFVSRGSLYFTLPTTGLIIQVLGGPSVYWKEPFLFCRRTDEITAAMKPYPLNVTDISAYPSPESLPALLPSHHSFAASNAPENAKWIYKFFNMTAFDTFTRPNESHAYANGTCANIQWSSTDGSSGYQVHFIQQFVKREGPHVRIKEHEDFVRSIHRNLTAKNAFMDYRVAFSVPDLQPYIENFKRHNEPILLENGPSPRLRAMAPNGYLFELFQDKKSEKYTQTSNLRKFLGTFPRD